MAITRAQQVRQMLEDGGMLVSPSRDGRRPGYRRSNYDSSGGGTASSSKSSDRSPGPSGKDDDPSPQDNRVAAATNIASLQKAYGVSKKGLTENQKRRREEAKANRKTAIQRLRPESGLSKIIRQGGLIPSFLKNITNSQFNLDRRKKFMGDLDALSKRFQVRRNINLPFNIGSFDANARIKNNLLQNLLNEAQEDLGLVAMSPGPFDYMNKRAISLSDLPKDKQEEIYDKVMDARMAGQTDAAGNLKAGFMFDSQGNIISTGNDGRDSVESDLEQRLRLLEEQNAALKNTTPTTTSNPLGGLGFRFLAEGGMPEDAPVGGIMDIESGRQMYFLGKLVKKATRAVKKIAKSPIGKAALLYAGGAGLGSLASGGGLGSLFKLGTYAPSTVAANFPKIFSGTGLKNILVGGKDFFGERSRDYTPFSGLFGKGGELSFGKVATFASLLPLLGLGTGDESEEEAEKIIRGSGLDIASIRNNPYTFRSSVGDGTGLGRRFVADGGRIGFRDGTSEFMDFVRSMGLSEDKLKQLDINSYNAVLQAFQRAKEGQKPQTEEKEMAEGGKAEPVAKDTMPLLKMGGKEMDLRDNGGFVPIGRMERADDVPARLSKNEFVFTADAVRNAGGGDIDKGAEVMYNMMQNLESGGEVSEESQGLKGAREMFQTSKRLEEVL
tara:strand:+ start:342 stop:2345 length:2004 start_codon:yes stop_codon:yes gene_type:complete